MTDSADNRINIILNELYAIDPDLERFKADLPRLIATLETHQPTVIIDEKFATDLRASLLSRAQASPKIPEASVPSPYIWWLTRLAPVGVALGLLITTLAPDRPHTPTEELEPVTPPATQEDAGTSEMRLKTFEATETGDVSLFSTLPATEFVTPPLEVIPPLVGETLTITTLNAPLSGWLVIQAETATGQSEILAETLINPGEQRDLVLGLTRPLTYPEMITVTLYTANGLEKFDVTQENIQLDPASSSPITVTVPVISELEMGLME